MLSSIDDTGLLNVYQIMCSECCDEYLSFSTLLMGRGEKLFGGSNMLVFHISSTYIIRNRAKALTYSYCQIDSMSFFVVDVKPIGGNPSNMLVPRHFILYVHIHDCIVTPLPISPKASSFHDTEQPYDIPLENVTRPILSNSII